MYLDMSELNVMPHARAEQLICLPKSNIAQQPLDEEHLQSTSASSGCSCWMGQTANGRTTRNKCNPSRCSDET